MSGRTAPAHAAGCAIDSSCSAAFRRRLAEVLASWRPDVVQIQYTAMGVHLREIERAGRPVVLWEPDPAMHAAIDLGRLCSNDPVCAQHAPGDQHECRFLHGAACHGCLLIAETSCEQHNDFLDRALVISTVDGDGAEFFGRDVP